MTRVIIFILLFSPLLVKAQWTLNGSNIYNTNTGFVGIGTTTPTFKLHVNSTTSDGLISLFEKNYGGERGLIAMYAYLPTYTSNTYQKNSVMLYASGASTQHFTISNAIVNGTIRFQTGGVVDQSFERMRIDGSGNVGIGTTVPAYKLDVNGIINATALYVNGAPVSTGASSQWINNSANIYFNTGSVGIGTSSPNSSYKLDVGGVINASAIYINGAPFAGGGSQWTTSSSNIHFATGNVGIGTTSPDAKLAVKGTIHAQEVKVDLAVPGPDYVFNADYKLLSLEEIKAYIDKNKHLPEMPSAKEMEANGVQLGEMNMLLLKKIEELTLYVIKLQEKNKALESRVSKIER